MNIFKRVFACCIFLVIVLLLLLNTSNWTGLAYKFAKEKVVNSNFEKPVEIKDNVKIRVAIVSDIENDVDAFEDALKNVTNMQIDTVFVLGDITSLGTKEDMSKISIIGSKFKGEIYYIPGDRDLWKSGLENFNFTFGEDFYVKEIGGIKFLFIDNADEYNGISDSQFKFIEENLPGTDFVLLHNPIFFEGSIFSGLFHKGMGQYSEVVELQRIKLLTKIEESSSIRAVFAGDLHLFTEAIDNKQSGLKHYTIGALNEARSLGPSSFVVLTVYESKKYDVESFSLGK